MFLKGNLRIQVGDQSLHYIHQKITSFGVTGLPWGTLDPVEHFGRAVMVGINIEHPVKWSLQAPAQIIRETTVHSSQMVIKFHLSPEELKTLNGLIEKHGGYPTEYIRKYPRIPSSQFIQTFPLYALVTTHQNTTITYNVENLSPNGILISTENRISLENNPGERLILTLDPRGWFPHQIRAEGLICRIMDDLAPGTGNTHRRLGVKFTKMHENDKASFLSLLKNILEDLQTQKHKS